MNIPKQLRKQVAANQEKIDKLTALNEKLEGAISALNGESVADIEENTTEVEPTKRKYKKRKYKMKRSRRAVRKINGSSARIAWKEKIESYFKDKKQVASAEDILTDLYGKPHHKTKKVLKKRLETILYFYNRNGSLKVSNKGDEKYYGPPTMFQGSEIIDSCKP